MAKALETMPIGWNTFIVIATRGHKLDAHCLRAAVKTSARYVGLLGSKRKTILIAKMLRDEGVDEDRIRAVHAPIGLDLGGRTPAEIALSVMAELSLERHGGSGKPLRLADELGWTVFPPYRRQGYATEVARALMDWAASEHAVRRFVSATTPDNVASLRVHEKLGFVATGEIVDGELIFELRR